MHSTNLLYYCLHHHHHHHYSYYYCYCYCCCYHNCLFKIRYALLFVEI